MLRASRKPNGGSAVSIPAPFLEEIRERLRGARGGFVAEGG
jgi:hypothetical protein